MCVIGLLYINLDQTISCLQCKLHMQAHVSNDILIKFRFIATEFSPEQCEAPNLNADTVLQTFARTCYEFHVTRGESYEKAQQICKSHGNYRFSPLLSLLIFSFFFKCKKCNFCLFEK